MCWTTRHPEVRSLVNTERQPHSRSKLVQAWSFRFSQSWMDLNSQYSPTLFQAAAAKGLRAETHTTIES